VIWRKSGANCRTKTGRNTSASANDRRSTRRETVVLLAQVKSGTAVSVTDTIPGMEVPVLLEGMSTNEKFCFKVKKNRKFYHAKIYRMK